MRQTYKANYPDIRDAEGRLEILRKQRDELQKQQDAEQAKPPEPRARRSRTSARAEAVSNLERLRSTRPRRWTKSLEMQGRQLRKEHRTPPEQLESYQARLAATSGIEAKYADLVHESQEAREKYQVSADQAATGGAERRAASEKGRRESGRARPSVAAHSAGETEPVAVCGRWDGDRVHSRPGAGGRSGSEGYFSQESEGRSGVYESSRVEQHSAARKHDARAAETQSCLPGVVCRRDRRNSGGQRFALLPLHLCGLNTQNFRITTAGRLAERDLS